MLCTTTSVDNPNKKGLSNNEMPPKSFMSNFLGALHRLPSHAGEGLGGLDFYVGFAIISVEDAAADASIDFCSKRRAI